MTTPILKVQQLHAGYGKAEVLHGISLEAAKGSVITVIRSEEHTSELQSH